MLYGNYVASGQIVLSKTLRDLKFDDRRKHHRIGLSVPDIFRGNEP